MQLMKQLLVMNESAPATSTGEHSRLSCSGAERWLTCPASITHVEKLGLKDKGNRAASQGTVAHGVGEESVLSGKSPWSFEGNKRNADGIQFTIDAEMIEAVEVYTKYINELQLRYLTHDLDVAVEQKLKLTRLGVDGMDGGTGDCLIVNLIQKVAYMIDYKHGIGTVDIFDNPQLGWYGVGTLIKLYEKGIDLDNWVIINVVVQPRSPHVDGPIRYQEIPAAELLAWAVAVGVPGAHLVNSENPPYNPSPEACLYCRGNGNCEAADKYNQEMAVIDFDDFTDKPDANLIPTVISLTEKQKLGIMVHAKMIKKYVDAVSEQVTDEILQGSDAYNDYLKPVRKQTRRKFKDSAIDELSLYLDDGDICDKKIKGIGKIEHALKRDYDKKTREKLMKSITDKPDGSITVAPITDKRKSIDLSPEADFVGFIDCEEYEEL